MEQHPHIHSRLGAGHSPHHSPLWAPQWRLRGICAGGIWVLPNIHTDTSLVPASIVSDYVKRYGHSRIMFGSTFLSGDPVSEMRKVQRMGFPEDVSRAVLGENVIRLMTESQGGRSSFTP